MVLVLLSWSLSMNLYNLQAEWWQWNAKMFLLIMWSMCAVGISSLSKTFICSLTLKGEIKGLGGGKFGSSDVKCGNYYFMLVFPHSGLVEKKIFWCLEDLVSIYLWNGSSTHYHCMHVGWRLQGWCMDLMQLYFSCGICEIGQWLYSLLS